MLEGRLGVSERVGDGGSANGDRRPVKGSEWSVERQRCCCCSLHHLGHVFESSSPKARLAGARAGLGGCLAQPIFTPPAKPRRTQRQPVDPPFYSSIHPHPAPPPLSTLPIPTSQWPSNPLPAYVLPLMPPRAWGPTTNDWLCRCSAAPSCSTFPSPLVRSPRNPWSLALRSCFEALQWARGVDMEPRLT